MGEKNAKEECERGIAKERNGTQNISRSQNFPISEWKKSRWNAVFSNLILSRLIERKLHIMSTEEVSLQQPALAS